MASMTTCSLCGLSTQYPLTDAAGKSFCCPACLEVSTLLADEDHDASAVRPVSAELRETVLQLAGLWCLSCADLIRRRLQRTPGVMSAEISFSRREARVRFAPDQTNEKRLIRAVRRGGYRAWLAADELYDEEEAHWMRLLAGGTLAMKVMVISFIIYFREWTGLAGPETEWLTDLFGIMMIPLATGVVLVLGWPIARAGWAALRQGRPNSHSLVTLGALSAYILSLRNVFVGGNVYFDTTAILFFLLALGRWLEMRAQKESQEAVESLWQQLPAEATLITAAGEAVVAAEEVPLGGRVRVKAGERIPVDGLVSTGRSDVDESWLTGEPEPVLRQAGDAVLAGSIALDGAFELITTARGSTTLLGQIGRLLYEATWQRAPAERLADRLAAWMMPVALLAAAGAFSFWTIRSGVEVGLITALSVLLIACPCALGIATPLTLWLGLGRAAESGVLLRRTGVLEQLANVQHAFFDKTGTLTLRPLRLKRLYAVHNETELRSKVAALEAFSEHPIAAALNHQLPTPTNMPAPEAFQTLPGQGVTGTLAGQQIWVGSRSLMTAADLAVPGALDREAESWLAAGLRVVYAGWSGTVQGLLGLGEALRPDVDKVLAELQALGLTVTVLTGDESFRAQLPANVVVKRGLKPDDKVAHIEAASGHSVMIGDGLNDSPALATAGVGLALRQGADLACATADGVLLKDELWAVPWLVVLARQTMKIVRQNLGWAFAYNGIGLLVAVAGFLQPSLAALLMVLSNLIVTSNALRLRRWQSPAEIDLESTSKEWSELLSGTLKPGKGVLTP